MKKYKLIILTLVALPFWGYSQESDTKDTVIVNFGEQSRIVFYVNEKNDLESLEQYDLNAIASDIKKKLQTVESGVIESDAEEEFRKDTIVNERKEVFREGSDNESEPYDDRKVINRYKTKHFFNLDLGLSNYMENGGFPSDNNELYAVRPLWSWYVGFSTNYRSQVVGKLFVEYGLGVSWYNFKFENDDVRLVNDDVNSQVNFVLDGSGTDYVKSKLSATHLNLSLVPTLDFGKSVKVHKHRWFNDDDDDVQRKFRIGVGGYAGYKIGSHAKYVTEDGGDKVKDKNRDSFYLNNWRYGARLQLGFRDTDIFFNYDLNELFLEGSGPKLNAFSFGIVL